jgi:uncharacterized membrane protein YdjX (TVP38/TMEM64 family)
MLSVHRADELRASVLAYGPIAPVIFIAVYVVAGLAFVPGFVLTLLAGVVFGPWGGLLYASLGSTLAACVAFLIARYALRGVVERWMGRRPTLRRLDAAVTRHGVRVVMVTRLLPILPFGVLNYAYGATGVGFAGYAVTSWLCMLPATAVLTFTADGVLTGHADQPRMVAWLGLAGLMLIVVSFVPRGLARWSATVRELGMVDRRPAAIRRRTGRLGGPMAPKPEE